MITITPADTRLATRTFSPALQDATAKADALADRRATADRILADALAAGLDTTAPQQVVDALKARQRTLDTTIDRLLQGWRANLNNSDLIWED